MHLSKVRFGATFNTGNYTSQRIEIEADLDDGYGTTIDEAMAKLRELVAEQSPLTTGQREDWHYTRQQMEGEKRELEAKLTDLRKRVQDAYAFLERAGQLTNDEVLEREYPF